MFVYPFTGLIVSGVQVNWLNYFKYIILPLTKNASFFYTKLPPHSYPNITLR